MESVVFDVLVVIIFVLALCFVYFTNKAILKLKRAKRILSDVIGWKRSEQEKLKPCCHIWEEYLEGEVDGYFKRYRCVKCGQKRT